PQADSYIVAVPTPFRDGKVPDLSYIEESTRSIAATLTGGELIILESTSPPGATEFVAQTVMDARPDLTLEPDLPNTLYPPHCRERVRTGRIRIRQPRNDRIIGSANGDAGERARDLYRLFGEAERLLNEARTAEMAKLTEN